MESLSQKFYEQPKPTLQACTSVLIINGFNPADNYATNAGRAIANASIDGNTVFTFAMDTTDDANGTGLEITFAETVASITGTALASDDLSLAFSDGTTFDCVLDMQDEAIDGSEASKPISSFVIPLKRPQISV